MGTILKILEVVDKFKHKPQVNKTFKEILHEEMKKLNAGHIDTRV